MRIRQSYDIKNLFKQLGLPNDSGSIDGFTSKNQQTANVKLHQTDF